MASDKVQKIVDSIKELTVVEAFELKKSLEETFDVKASAPMAMMAMPAAGAAAAEPAEEKTEFDVILTDAGANKIGVIKVVKNITGLGLKEAKDLVDAVAAGPKPVKEGAKKEEAEDIKKQIEAEGGKVEVK
jgi:large subunit ribosomal protein L7/L12